MEINCDGSNPEFVRCGAGDTMTPMWISLVTTVFYLRGKWKKIAFSEPIMEK